MKKSLIIFTFLLLTTGIFFWSHHYYEEKYITLSDKLVVMEYQVLDKDVWTADKDQKQHRLSRDASYDELIFMQREARTAHQRSTMGKEIVRFAALGSMGYLLYIIVWLFAYVKMIRNRGYVEVIEAAKNLAEKIGDSSQLPKN